MPLLEVRNLSVQFPTALGAFTAVDGIDLAIDPGEVLGIVGESGSGKSLALLALMGLVPFPGRVRADRIVFDGADLATMSARARRRLLGKHMAMIFQEPMTSLNPCFTVGFQIGETLREHEGGSTAERRRRTIELLEQVGIAAPETRLGAFPHQLSGGMNQRVMIAMAIACNPRLLLADEPTTALDVTIQAQILDLLIALQKARSMALILVTHDMGVVAETAHRVAVMYAGAIVEERAAAALFATPRHPYAAALLASLPERSAGGARLETIGGVVPGALDRPAGCLFEPRCRFAIPRCQAERPLRAPAADGAVRCHRPLDAAGQPT